MTKENKVIIKKVEETLKSKQKNGSIETLAEETMYLTGSMVVLHEIFGNDDKLDSVPPRWVFQSLRGNSIIEDFKYAK